MGIRLVSLNLYHDRIERAARLANSAAVLNEMGGDIVALQEVATGLFLPGDPIEILVQATGNKTPHTAQFWLETNFGIYKNGLGLLSRYPIVRTEEQKLSSNVFWDLKGFQLTDVQTPEGIIHVINLHLRSSGGTGVKADELAELSDFIKKLDTRYPTILLGDFNLDWHNPVFREFTKHIGAKSFFDYMAETGPIATWTPNYEDPCNREVGAEGGQQLDNILLIGGAEAMKWTFECPEVRIPIAVPHLSDHCPVSVDLISTPQQPRTLSSRTPNCMAK